MDNKEEANVCLDRKGVYDKLTSNGRQWVAFLLLFVLIFIIYSNTLDASWHMDDIHNITANSRIHLKDLYPASIYNIFFADSDFSSRISRPVSFITFAVNWYFSKNNVTSYHIVNIIIHSFVAFFLFLTILVLFDSPILQNKYEDGKYFIALLTAALWASHPIQTQAVTYVVQRMASLATMFYIGAIYFYLKGRLSNRFLNRVLFLSCCLVSYLLGVGSKENAIMLPASLLLIEWLFFHDYCLPKMKGNVFFGLGIAGLFVVVLGFAVLYFRKDLLFVIEGYEYRSFSLFERVLTEPRVIVFYLSQIFYPIVGRLSVDHDIVVSSSLWQPWTTPFAVLFIFTLIALTILMRSKSPSLSFAIIFYFLNHIIESTILPLEIIFEHRNYLPSLFLFLPISIGLKKLIDFYRRGNRFLYIMINLFVILLIIGVGSGTYIRNFVWANQKTLWEDALRKSPGRARPYQNLADGYFKRIGEMDKALELYEKARSLKDDNLWRPQRVSLINMARIYARKKYEYNKAIELYKKILNIEQYKNYELARFEMIYALIGAGRFDEASSNADLLLLKKPYDLDYLNIKSFILLRLNQNREALSYGIRALRTSADNRKTLLNVAIALKSLGRYDSVEHFLNRAKRLYPDDIVVMFGMIENNLESGNTVAAKQNSEEMIARFNVHEIDRALKKLSTDNSMWPISRQLIAPVIEDVLKEKSKEIATFSSGTVEEKTIVGKFLQ